MQHALNTVNQLIVSRSPAVNSQMENYMKHITTLYGDASNLVKLRVVQGLVSITDMDLDLVLKPEHFTALAQLMMHGLQNKEDHRIAQASCEFWSALVCGVAENQEYKNSLL
jgi:hypothetical protein